jgi:phosphoadenosine phosphosulfate reductase
MAGGKRQNQDAVRWPKYKAAYIRAFDKMLIAREKDGLGNNWKTGQEVWDWWTTEKEEQEEADDCQMGLMI